jgi:hypothetical protein
MPVQVIEETVDKEVTFLKDMSVEFVSLVRHGANQMPFRVIKSQQKGGESKAMMIIQSVLMPKHLELASIKEKEEMAWLADANTEKGKDFEEYRTYQQETIDNFEASSIKMIKVHEDGVWVLAGSAKDGAKLERSISLGNEEEAAAKVLPTSPMDSALPADVSNAAAVSFRDVFYKELDNMMAVITGVLNQRSGEAKKRKSAILNAIDAFRSFLAMGVDALNGNAAKIDERPQVQGATKTETEEEAMFNTKEEFLEALREGLKEEIPGMIDEHLLALQSLKDAEKKAEGEGTEKNEEAETEGTEKKDKDKDDNEVKVLRETVDNLSKAIADLTKKWENSLETEPTGGTDAGQEDGKGSGEDKKKDESVFTGLLVSA